MVHMVLFIWMYSFQYLNKYYKFFVGYNDTTLYKVLKKTCILSFLVNYKHYLLHDVLHLQL